MKDEGRFEEVSRVINDALLERQIPSISVAVAEKGKIIWEESFGWADREKRIPATPNTMYSLASVSKPYTATGVMKLVNDGKIELDRPINDYLPRDSKFSVWIGNEKDMFCLK